MIICLTEEMFFSLVETYKRERKREGKRGRGGRERTFKYEQKRARYFSPALTVETDSYPDLGGRLRPPSKSLLSLRFPLKEIVEKEKQLTENRKYPGRTRYSYRSTKILRLIVREKRVSSSIELKTRAESGKHERQQCALCGYVLVKTDGNRASEAQKHQSSRYDQQHEANGYQVSCRNRYSETRQ